MQNFVRYETPSAFHRQSGLVCTGFGSYSHKTDLCAPRQLSCYAALWISQGAGWLETSATPHRLPIVGNSLFWLFPHVTHSYAPDHNGWTEQWVLFEGTLAETFERMGFLSAQHPVQYLRFSEQIETLFAQLALDFGSDGPFASVLGAARVHQLIVTAHHFSQAGDEQEPDEIQQIKKWLDEHALEAVNFEEIAKNFHLGYSTLRRLFKQATGYSPKEYVLRIRLTRAKKLLAFTQQNIGEITRACGFADPYYFSRLFRLKEGISPTEFRFQQQSAHQTI